MQKQILVGIGVLALLLLVIFLETRLGKRDKHVEIADPPICILYQFPDGRMEDLCYKKSFLDSCIGGTKGLGEYLRTGKCIS